MQKIFRAAGVYVPVFSLRTKKSCGIGDFGDLKVLIDWCTKVGFKVIQLLPINDTSITMTWRDSYPYSLLSVCALHPIYLNLDAFSKESLSINEQINLSRLDLPQDYVDYEGVLKAKLSISHQFYEKYYFQLIENEFFHQFILDNSPWLKPYAVYCFLRDKYQGCDTALWEEGSVYNEELVDIYTNPSNPSYKEVCFYFFLQFHLYTQLDQVCDYAKEHGISLKGDFTVGVNKQSVETWQDRQYFRLENSIGAPPDAYSDQGQNWQFPGYNFDVMKQDNYSWFKKRLTHLARFFDIMRIDHILGYFRFWEIGKGCQSGLFGHFNPALPLTEEELKVHGFTDLERLVKPIVSEQFLIENSINNFNEFFTPFSSSLYTLKDTLDSEDKIEALNLNRELKDFLKRCLASVILVKGDKRSEFHPRIAFHNTCSYSSFNMQEKEALDEIYHDYFFVRQESLWLNHAREILSFFEKSTTMTLCAEDLGFVPACVEPLLSELSLLTLYIQRMPKKSGEEFAHTEDYEKLSVCSPSNHDTSTLRGWWEEDLAKSQRYFTTILKQTGEAPKTLEPWIAEKIIYNHLNSKSTWSLFLFQDLLAIDAETPKVPPREERINDPFNPQHYWRYRLPLYIEDLIENVPFTDKLKQLLLRTSRI